jgi:hypothetical protein
VVDILSINRVHVYSIPPWKNQRALLEGSTQRDVQGRRGNIVI